MTLGSENETRLRQKASHGRVTCAFLPAVVLPVELPGKSTQCRAALDAKGDKKGGAAAGSGVWHLVAIRQYQF